MAIEFVTGGLGDGKSLYAASRLKQYLAAGKKVATNYNIDLQALCSPGNKHSRLVRIPDSPTQDDFRAIGLGSDTPGDKNNGLLLLDELGTWFNARDFASKERLKVLKYIIHLRKKRWDVVFIVQDFTMVDKQLRGSMTTYLTSCRNSHKGFMLFRLLPKFHYAVVRNKDRIPIRTDYLFGPELRSLYPIYDTEQLFNVEDDADEDDVFGDPALKAREAHYAGLNGLYCVLPPGYTLPPAQQPAVAPSRPSLRPKAMALAAVLALVALFNWPKAQGGAKAPAVALQPAVEAQVAVLNTPTVPQTPSGFDLADLRVVGFSRFGDAYHYVLEAPGGIRLDSHQLQAQGYKIKPRPENHVLVVAPDNRFATIR